MKLPDLAELQGNILRGYRTARVRHIAARVRDGAGARRWLGAAARGEGPMPVTPGSDWGATKPASMFNVGLTHEGMRALGVPGAARAAFSRAFREGAAARAETVGDWGDSAPAAWRPCWRDAAALHLVLTIHADSAEALDRAEAALPFGAALDRLGAEEGAWFAPDIVHFGYRDNISQPRFRGVDPKGRWDDQPAAPLGVVLLGHETAMEQLRWTLPQPEVLGMNGAFGAFRVLEQDVEGFEAFLDRAAETLLAAPEAAHLLPPGFDGDRRARLREAAAAKLAGRWRSGTPLALSPLDPAPEPPVSDTKFDFSDDPDGLRCPIGSHLRRTNPRSARIVQRVANHTRRLVRRNFPYGPAFDPANPVKAERGLVGHFLCADLSAQFEAVQYDWINLGLQDPRITGTNDPLLGDNDPAASRFEIPTPSGPIRLRGFPRLVRTRGAAYLFLPSLPALRWIGSLAGG